MANDNRQKGLGKGLRALFDNVDSLSAISKTRSTSTKEIALEDIVQNEKQPRKYFEQSLLDELAESIKALGLIQPITVAEEESGKYTIISGERRYRASMQAGLKTIPVYIRKVDDTQMLEMALVENVQREELNALEIAHCLNRLMEECGMTQEGLSKRIGKQRSTIANYVRLLRLPVEVQLALQRNLLSMGHARALLSLDDSKAIIELADRIVSEGLSVRQVEGIVKKGKGKKGAKKAPVNPEYFPILANKMKRFMNHNVDVRRASDGKTRITISVNSDEEVVKLLQKFENL